MGVLLVQRACGQCGRASRRGGAGPGTCRWPGSFSADGKAVAYRSPYRAHRFDAGRPRRFVVRGLGSRGSRHDRRQHDGGPRKSRTPMVYASGEVPARFRSSGVRRIDRRLSGMGDARGRNGRARIGSAALCARRRPRCGDQLAQRRRRPHARGAAKARRASGRSLRQARRQDRVHPRMGLEPLARGRRAADAHGRLPFDFRPENSRA